MRTKFILTSISIILCLFTITVNITFSQTSGINITLTLEQARAKAQLILTEDIKSSANEWTENCRITNYYPLYLPGIDFPAYYEFKIKNNKLLTRRIKSPEVFRY